ncbi:MAG: hypothetical protein ACRD6U_10965 [Nitrososphaeraceae archaeon]
MAANNNDNSKRIIHLKKSEELQSSGLVTDSVYYIDTHDIKISLNHNACADIIFTLDHKKWQKNLNTIEEMVEENGITEKETIRLLKYHLNDNHDEIYNSITNEGSNNNDTDDDDDDDNKSKKEVVVFKYSQMGKGPLHEAIIVDGLPFFLNYHHITNTFELVEKIEESSRILIPPNEENYPSSPAYSFESNEELAFFMQKAREVTLDQLLKFSKNIFLKYVDQDYHIVIILAADAIWTYFQDLFPATHYGEGVGTNDVGKSSIGYTFENTGYRVVKATAISGANYYRVLGNIEPGQCVIIEDEGDNINEDPEKVKILKAGYEYNVKVPKINMNITNQAQNWYFAYCYKIILAEKSLKEYKVPGLVDRTFSFPCRPGKVKYSIKEIVSQNINKRPSLQKLYNELLSFRKLMLCYRLIHYKDLLPDIETGLKNRDEELSKPLLQLFYGNESLKNDIIPTLEEFVKQRRTRKANSLEAALYPIIKKFVFSEVGLDSLQNTTTYSELKAKKKIIKVGFWRIWDYIKEGGIDGHYDEKKKYQYETIDHGNLYLNSLPTIIRDKFTATRKIEDYGVALIFDVDKLEKFEDRYSNIYLKGENVKIEVKLKTETDDDETGDSGDFGDFLGVRSNILEKNLQEEQDNNNNTSTLFEDSTQSNSNSKYNNTHAFQKSQESQESQESPVINNQEEKN